MDSLDRIEHLVRECLLVNSLLGLDSDSDIRRAAELLHGGGLDSGTVEDLGDLGRRHRFREAKLDYRAAGEVKSESEALYAEEPD